MQLQLHQVGCMENWSYNWMNIQVTFAILLPLTPLNHSSHNQNTVSKIFLMLYEAVKSKTRNLEVMCAVSIRMTSTKRRDYGIPCQCQTKQACQSDQNNNRGSSHSHGLQPNNIYIIKQLLHLTTVTDSKKFNQCQHSRDAVQWNSVPTNNALWRTFTSIFPQYISEDRRWVICHNINGKTVCDFLTAAVS